MRGISICDRGSKTSEAPKPICREKNCPASWKAEKMRFMMKPRSSPMATSPSTSNP